MTVVMRSLILPDDWPWVKEHMSTLLVEDTKGIVAEVDGVRSAAFIFDSWTHTSVCSHILVNNPIVFKHGFLEAAAEYVYITCDRGIIYGQIPSSNAKALKLDLHIGFVEVARFKDAIMYGEDLIIMELRKEDCKFLRSELKEAV